MSEKNENIALADNSVISSILGKLGGMAHVKDMLDYVGGQERLDLGLFF